MPSWLRSIALLIRPLGRLYRHNLTLRADIDSLRRQLADANAKVTELETSNYVLRSDNHRLINRVDKLLEKRGAIQKFNQSSSNE